ncbi:SusC/RagA family TonB-linked outer membrane protein [Pseudobacter ginsenosidimutans]|uniref:TonB-linked SusC/RagA family outer membrane protein n=1 Tax=Pseudobacter ginsenosidimutans TaxID=661488 RepID=A0A4V2F1T2_9BACT|nr:SusC/RagA family TonB-linked outer membrane protein [Pseudobacter ginsenosidimutans]QEC43480.1 SusC/RagA family TonB-linked outer membrane protein [Pseudobacter ginsenosidimutans]RZS74866.1 TonB-linked SusC/RagA family outer membrane protein [Pseudobacter ginsenosidimutans]
MLQSTPEKLTGKTAYAPGMEPKPAGRQRFLPILLIICLAPLFSTAQKVTLKGELSLQQIFAEIKKQTNYAVIYNPETIDVRGRVDVNASNQPLEAFIKTILIDFPYTYNISGSNIIIIKREIVVPPLPAAGKRDIHGLITDGKTNQPLASVTVIINGTRQATQTDAAGKFVLTNVPDDFSITVSSVGYEKLVRKIGKSELYLPIPLTVATSVLDEAVVQAFGTTTRRRATGNIVKVSGEEIEKLPVMNPLLALQGKVPGLTIQPLGASASGMMKVEIRGRNNVNPNSLSEPLYVIDGVPQTVLEVKGSTRYGLNVSGGMVQSGASATKGQSPLFGMNPADIESISVLSDGDATAIYGSRGANGVIMITTRKAKAGKTAFNLKVEQGINKVPRYLDMLDIDEYLAIRREAFKNDGIIPTAANAPDLMVWDLNRNVDWQKELMGKGGGFQSYSASISGGDARTAFRLSASHMNTVDLQSIEGHNKATNLSFSGSHSSLNQKLTVSLNGNLAFKDVNAILDRTGGFLLPPNAPPIYDDKGNLNYADWNAINQPFGYMFDYRLMPNDVKTNMLIGGFQLNYKPVKGLSITGTAGLNNSTLNNTLITPIAAQNPILNPTGRSIVGRTVANNLELSQQTNYGFFLGKGKMELLAGVSYQQTTTTTNTINALAFSSDDLLNNVSNAATTITTEGKSQYRYASVFGRITYNWDGKYTINLNGRRDGSSKFRRGKQYGNFGSIGLAWTLDQEEWMKKIMPEWIGMFKLWANYGLSGGDNVADYEFFPQWNNRRIGAISNTALNYDYNGIKPYQQVVPVNQEFQWDENRKFDAGIDLSLFRDRVNVTASWYLNRISNGIVRLPMPFYTGLNNINANSPAIVHNSGLILSLSADLISNGKVKWNVTFNYSRNRNKLAAFPGIDQTVYASQLVVGQPLNMRYVTHYLGVDPLTGNYVFEDRNGDGRIMLNQGVAPGTGSDDAYIGVNPDPTYDGGFGTSVMYKGLSFAMGFTYSKKIGSHPFMSIVPGKMTNMPLPAEIRDDHWQKPGDNASYAKYTTSGGSTLTGSDRGYVDASSIQCNRASLAWTLPHKTIKRAGMAGCTVGVNVSNLFTITRFKADPALMANSYIPLPRTIAGSISFTF